MGNPRLPHTVATAGPATDAVEASPDTQPGAWSLRREWFRRSEVAPLVESSGSWDPSCAATCLTVSGRLALSVVGGDRT